MTPCHAIIVNRKISKRSRKRSKRRKVNIRNSIYRSTLFTLIIYAVKRFFFFIIMINIGDKRKSYGKFAILDSQNDN